MGNFQLLSPLKRHIFKNTPLWQINVRGSLWLSKGVLTYKSKGLSPRLFFSFTYSEFVPMHIYTSKMSQWFSCAWAAQPVWWMNCVTSADKYHTISQTNFSCLLSLVVYSHYFIDSAPSSGQQHNKRNNFPFLNVILSMGSWEMEKKLHTTLAGQGDLSCVRSTAFPYLDFSVTKACGICIEKAEKILAGIFCYIFNLLGIPWGEGRTEDGKCKERKTIDQLYCIYSLLPLSMTLLLYRFVQKQFCRPKKGSAQRSHL